jgi:hypothetical protein
MFLLYDLNYNEVWESRQSRAIKIEIEHVESNFLKRQDFLDCQDRL